MLRILGCFLLFFCCASSLHAQQAAYDPYAKEPVILNPVAPDGTLIWPSFYKSANTKAKFDGLFACGTCRGTNPRINGIISSNKLSVNELSEGTVLGYCVAVAPGTCTIRDITGQITTLVTHPMHATKISVVGPMNAHGLSEGLTVRFEAKVNEKNMGIDPLEALDVFTPNADTKIPPVQLNRLHTMIGTISRWEEKRQRVTISTDKTHRYVFTLAKHAKINVEASTMNLIFPGDEVSAKGKLYLGVGTGTQSTIFASHIEAKKDPSPLPNVVAKEEEPEQK